MGIIVVTYDKIGPCQQVYGDLVFSPSSEGLAPCSIIERWPSSPPQTSSSPLQIVFFFDYGFLGKKIIAHF